MAFAFIFCLDENSEANKLEGVVLDTFLKLKEEGVLAKHMRRMEERFSNMQCLIHNDLHSSSVMKKGDQIRVSFNHTSFLIGSSRLTAVTSRAIIDVSGRN